MANVSTNALTDLLGVDAGDPTALRVGIGTSVFNSGRMQIAAAPHNNTVFTHFNDGATIPAGLVLSNTNAASAATYGTGLGGTSVLTSDDAAGVGACIGTGLLWQCDRQPSDMPLTFETKVSCGTLATAEYFFGLSSSAGAANLIALSATSTFTTSTAGDAAFIGYSATPTSGAAYTAGGNKHVMVASNNGTDAIVAVGGGVFVTATSYTYRIEADYLGNVKYYLNGELLATQALALRPSVPLCALAMAIPRATAGGAERVITLDYFGITGV